MHIFSIISIAAYCVSVSCVTGKLGWLDWLWWLDWQWLDWKMRIRRQCVVSMNVWVCIYKWKWIYMKCNCVYVWLSDNEWTVLRSCERIVQIYVINKFDWNKISFYCCQTNLSIIFCLYTSTIYSECLNSGVIQSCTVWMLEI